MPLTIKKCSQDEQGYLGQLIKGEVTHHHIFILQHISTFGTGSLVLENMGKMVGNLSLHKGKNMSTHLCFGQF